jgi:uncharacterized protein (TIGR03437 family)
MTFRIVFVFLFLTAARIAAQPAINAGGVLNAASYALPGLPNSGIAQGSMFAVFGSNLGPHPLLSASALPLPTALGGTSASITVGGKTVDAPLFYVSVTQLAAVMPSNAPLGAGVLKVTYRGVSSAGAPVTVVRNAPGILTLNSAGYGPATLQNYNSPADQPVNTVIESAHPGQVEILWATGLGPISASDSVAPPVGNLPFKIEVFVGGKVANVSYAGRSAQFPGIDQVIFSVPDGVAGCQVPVYVKAEGVSSNYATMAVAADGKVCGDWHGFSASEMQMLGGQAESRIGSISLGQSRTALGTPGGTSDSVAEAASGRFYRRSIYETLYAMGPKESGIMLGSCMVYGMGAQDPIQWTPGDPAAGQLLDAGAALYVTGPLGKVQIDRAGQGGYEHALGGAGQGEYLAPGQYSVDNGTGGADVGPFQATLAIPPAVSWTNADAIGVIPRNQALNLSWSGGDASREFVAITGAALDVTNRVTGSFVCAERVDAGKFSIPADVLSALPAANAWTTDGYPAGFLSVGTMPILSSARFQASGLDAAYFSYFRQQLKNVTYK